MADRPDEAQERTEQPTPRRLEEARNKGQVARSRELATTALLLAGAAALILSGPWAIEGLAAVMRASFRRGAELGAGELPVVLAFGEAVTEVALATAPFFVVVVAVATLAPLALGGWTFSAEGLAFKWEKIDPVRGLRRVFSWNGVVELLKAFAKFLVIGTTAVLILWLGMERFAHLGRLPLEPALAETVRLVAASFVLLALSTLLIALVDVPFQLWQHHKRLRMTRREVKEELKDTEGRPEVRSRIRSLQRELATRRMMEAVPKADVVVTNPQEYAVALRYAPETMQAPKLVAKGAGAVAARIRTAAEQHRVPLVAAPALARAIYYSTRLEREIPVGLYHAVAQVLAYVYRLRERPASEPPGFAPEDLPIPPEFRRYTERGT